MELINNLEKLVKGDLVMIYHKRDFKTFKGGNYIGKVEASNDEVLHIKTLKHTFKDREEEFVDEKWIILKTQEKIRKRKLKHKKKSFNKEYIIFKLSPSERTKLIREAMLEKLK